jgi:hypothetical protein
MQFRTQIPIPLSNHVDYYRKDGVFGFLFCWKHVLKFDYYKFQNHCNLLVIFNPVSIEKLVTRVVTKKLFRKKIFFFHNEQWHCFELHSQFLILIKFFFNFY